MPKPGSVFKFCLTVALALATAWAIRGQFGHEHGAAWAGAIGMLAVILLSGRPDWYVRAPAIVAVSALAWGVGGVMSYGIVVGYGKSDDFFNVLYGLSMLFVIGGLYGFIGGGLSGLMLEIREKQTNWAALLTQMIAGGFLVWAVLIYQLGYTMTPPRSEAWAGCLGASSALAWFLYRYKYHASLRVAFSTALGAGLGFAFGNFIQTLGTVSGISFNWWNAMEYSLGFFGGLGMAYGIAREQWPAPTAELKLSKEMKLSNLLGCFTLIILLPVINLIQAITAERLSRVGESAGYQDIARFVSAHQLTAWGISALLAVTLIFLTRDYYSSRPGVPGKLPGRKSIRGIFFFYLLWFMVLSNLVGGTWVLGKFGSQHLYWANLLVIMLLSRDMSIKGETPLWVPAKRWKQAFPVIFAVAMIVIILISLVSANIHDGLPGMHYRFGPNSRKEAAGAAKSGTADRYNMADFASVPKIDAHVHVRTNDPTFLLLARKDNFRLLSLSTDEAPGIQVQDDYTAGQMKAFPDILAYATAFPVSNWNSKNWQEQTISGLKRAFARGATSVKIYKNIGMELKDGDGKLVMIDDPRFDPVLDFLEKNHVPVTGHLGEPKNCWLSIEEMTIDTDKRYYSRHPEFHMYWHPEFPSYDEQIAARDRMLEKHPDLRFVGAHLGSLEWSTDELAKRLDRYPNMAVDMAARISHLQVQAMNDWQKVHDFFIRYQARLLYGTDRIADEADEPAAFKAHAHETWLLDWKFFCTAETMQSPSFEGEFKGLNLPREVIDKIYRLNAGKSFPALKKQ